MLYIKYFYDCESSLSDLASIGVNLICQLKWQLRNYILARAFFDFVTSAIIYRSSQFIR